ncbi:hypothetical protein Nmel_004369, partial [Mimus melanotis]
MKLKMTGSFFRTLGFQKSHRNRGDRSSTCSYSILLSQSIQVTVK